MGNRLQEMPTITSTMISPCVIGAILSWVAVFLSASINSKEGWAIQIVLINNQKKPEKLAELLSFFQQVIILFHPAKKDSYNLLEDGRFP